MAQYTYTKQVNATRLATEIVAAGLTTFDHIDTTVNNTVLIYFNTDLSSTDKTTLDTVVANHVLQTPLESAELQLNAAMMFGAHLTFQFIAENLVLGITQLGLTMHVRQTLSQVKDAMDTGSLYDAITEIKSIDPAALDATILTPDRLLTFRNQIETYLHVPLATSWDQAETW